MSSELLLYPSASSNAVDGFRGYRQQVDAIPLLSADEEKALAKRYHETDDLEAAQQLVLSQLRYVVRVAYQYQGYGLPIADLVQEGTVGLMKAVKRFDPSVGVRLVTFAVHWIKSEIHEYVIRNWRIVKVATTKAQRKCFFNLRRAKKRLGWFTQDEITQVATDLGVTPAEVQEMESRLNGQDMAFDPVSSEEEDAYAPSTYLNAPTQDDPAQIVLKADSSQQAQQILTHALADLDPRSYDIISKRWLAEDKAALKTLAKAHNVSIERVRQIESHAIKQLKIAFSDKHVLGQVE